MDDAEFEALYRREYPVLVGQLTVVCRDATEAADCVQEAFVKAWHHRRRLVAEGSPGGWVRTTAIHVAVSRSRRRVADLAAVRRWAARPVPPPPDLEAGQGLAALRRLPREQRQALGLHYLLDLPVAEVATLLGVPEGTVKARLHRGRQSLAVIMSAPSARPSPTGGPASPSSLDHAKGLQR